MAEPSAVVLMHANSSPCMIAANVLPSGCASTSLPYLAGEAEDMDAISTAHMQVIVALKFIVLFVLQKDIVSLQMESAYIHIFYENNKVSSAFFFVRFSSGIRTYGAK